LPEIKGLYQTLVESVTNETFDIDISTGPKYPKISIHVCKVIPREPISDSLGFALEDGDILDKLSSHINHIAGRRPVQTPEVSWLLIEAVKGYHDQYYVKCLSILLLGYR
jgi:hypothetical protein